MFVSISFLFILKFTATWCQFQTHIDLQKVDEIILNNETYNVLRPTIHKIVDHFKETILRRDTAFPTKRVFIDKNGFRHFWSGFENATTVLRKSFIDIKKTNELNRDKIVKGNRAKAVHNTANNTVTRKPKRKLPKRIKSPLLEPKKNNSIVLREGQQGGTLVKTSFFCPFFGVITMTSILDEK